MFDFGNMMNSIATMLFTTLSISTIVLPYMITILLHNIVKIANIDCDNTVENSNNMVKNIAIMYDYNIVKNHNMVNNIVVIFFTILLNSRTLMTILLHYCYFVPILWTILRSVMAKAGD